MCEAVGDVGIDRTLALDDLVDSAWRDADFFCEAKYADSPRREELFEYDPSWM